MRRIAEELLRVAREISAGSGSVGSRYRLLKDLSTKSGTQFKTGEELKVVEYGRDYPYLVKLQADDGRRLATRVQGAYAVLSGFPKPPSVGTMEKWDEDGASKAVDGTRVEPDGYSPSGAPSWMLVMGIV